MRSHHEILFPEEFNPLYLGKLGKKGFYTILDNFCIICVENSQGTNPGESPPLSAGTNTGREPREIALSRAFTH